MQKAALVIPLEAIKDCDAAIVGGKALSLAQLSRIGLTVPAGFCVTNLAYREHLNACDIMSYIRADLVRLEHAQFHEKNQILSNIRQAIVQARMSETLAEQIDRHYRKLAADHVAVRSSATAEDLPGHSFAGQHDTYLGIASLQDCLQAIKKCWASLWTDRAYEYRKKNGFDHLQVSMAVIVQSFIAADASGVIFTVDPATGRPGNMVIEACFGLGEALVSGKVTPDRFVVDKKKLRLLFRAISEKKIECVLDRDGTVKEQALSNERSIAWSLDKKQIRRLARLARKVEAEFGCPQDIEWAVCKKKIYTLQSRPITVIPQERSWEERQIWCSNPAKEVMPDVITPMTLSMILEAVGEKFFDPIFRMLCMDRGDHPIYALVAGRIYFNANIWGAVFRCVPGLRSFDFMELAGGHKGLREVVQRLQTATDEDLPDIKFNPLRFILRIPVTVIGALCSTPRKGERILAEISAKNERWIRLDVASLSAEQITMCCQELIMDFRELLGHVLYLFSILAALPMLDMVCTKWLSDSSSCTGRLLAGLGDMDDAVAGLDLWRLAVGANARPDVRDLILSSEDWRTIGPKLSVTDSGQEFLRNWGGFMDRHGHHCRGELELYNQRWFETPDYILKLVRTYIAQIGEIDPVENYSERAPERQQLQEQCRKRLRNPVKRTIFNHLLVRSQKGSVFRENVKSEVIKLVTAIRKMLIELGNRLGDKGVLKNRDDIFFLRLEEIEPVVQGKADFDIHQVIAVRRVEYDRNWSITPPDVVFGKFDPDRFVPDVMDKDTDVLNGLPVSPGVETGKARVILKADTDEHLSAGEILVAPFTDPGWTPYFVLAAGIVMDQGGLLSHGSIVAREYGIPAVVNVGAATKIIKTGQTIRVDGDRGVVTVLQ